METNSKLVAFVADCRHITAPHRYGTILLYISSSLHQNMKAFGIVRLLSWQHLCPVGSFILSRDMAVEPRNDLPRSTVVGYGIVAEYT